MQRGRRGPQEPVPLKLRGPARSDLGRLMSRLGPEWSRLGVLEKVCARALAQTRSMPLPLLEAWLRGDVELHLTPTSPEAPPHAQP